MSREYNTVNEVAGMLVRSHIALEEGGEDFLNAVIDRARELGYNVLAVLGHGNEGQMVSVWPAMEVDDGQQEG